MIKRDDGAYVSYDMLAMEVAAYKQFMETVFTAMSAIDAKITTLQGEIQEALNETRAMQDELARGGE
jgi:hypothetical protein